MVALSKLMQNRETLLEDICLVYTELFENHAHIGTLLKENGFEVEHENVYYSSVLSSSEYLGGTITLSELTKGNQQYIDFKIDDNQVGGCEMH